MVGYRSQIAARRRSLRQPHPLRPARPSHKPSQSHPVQSEQLRARLNAGAIIPRPGIDRFDSDTVVFTDGRSTRADLIVWAIGYRVSFPFLDTDLIRARDNDLPLWKRTVHPTFHWAEQLHVQRYKHKPSAL